VGRTESAPRPEAQANSAPSWPKVIATTFRLWLERRGKRVRTVGAVVSSAALAGAVVTVVLVNLVPARGASGQADLVRRGADRSLLALGGSVAAVASFGRSFEAAMAADLQARIAAGQQLLHNKNVHASSGARTELAAGGVDSRLLVVLAKLAGQRRMTIVAIPNASPDAAGPLLREAQISAANTGQLRSMLSFLRNQQAPYLPDQAALVRVARGKFVLDIQYDAPSPVGLLSAT
jgi:hypothetical protein